MKIKIKDFTFVGESRSSLYTSIAIPELSICFDMGYIHEAGLNQAVVLVSHGHGDHIGALQQHCAIRRLRGMSEPVYIMPEPCIKPFLALYNSFRALNSGLSEPQSLPQSLPQSSHFSVSSEGLYLKNFKITTFAMIHHSNPHGIKLEIPTYGYVVSEFRKKLKSEFQNIPKKELGQLAKSNTLIQDSVEYPLVGFTGDTIIEGLLQHQELLSAEYLIMECTFFEDFDQNQAKSQGHVHEHDIRENADKFLNKHLILCHFSLRYSDKEINEAKERIQKYFKDTPSTLKNSIPQVHILL